MKIHTETSYVKKNWNDYNPFSGKHNSTIIEQEPDISKGLALRLYNYAKKRLVDAGLGRAIDGCKVSVKTITGEEKPSYRTYWVEWETGKGARLGVHGIMISKRGWPMLDHSLFISEQ